MRVRWRWAAACTIAAAGLMASGAAYAACAATAKGAAEAGDGGGFRVRSMRWDPVLRKGWATVESCAHPEWPAVELPVSGLPRDAAGWRQGARESVGDGTQSVLPALPVVKAGDVVQLWSQEGDLRIEVAGRAEQSGALGAMVRVRLTRRSPLGPQIEEQVSGVVRGPGNVEMQR